MADSENPAQAVGDQPIGTQVAPADDVLLDPEVLKRELAEARKEAAKYRTTLRAAEQAQEAATAAALVEQGKYKELYEKEAASRAQLEAQAAQVAAQQLLASQQQAAALAAGLPAHMANRLIGATPEALAADAKQLAETLKLPPPATGPTNPATQRSATQTATFDPKNPPRLSSYEWKT